MEVSGFQELRDVSRTLYKTLQDLPTGAISHRNHQQIERNISLLKQRRDFFDLKLQLTQLTAAQITKSASSESVDTDENILEIKNKIMKKNLQEKQLRNAMFSSFVTSLLPNNDNPDILQYRKKIIEQMELARHINDKIQDCHEKYVIIISDNIQLKKEIISKQMDYKLMLNEKTTQNAQENENNIDGEYEKDLNLMKLRVQKINFMRIVTSRLLSYSKEPLGDKIDMCRVLENCRTPYTLESFL